jgi:hypothetical protein
VLTLTLSSVAAALDGFTGAFGIGVINKTAFAAGVASVPTPIVEQAWDGWIFWHAFALLAPSGTLDGNNRMEIPVDTKAMRKLDDESTIYGVLEVQEVGTAVMTPHQKWLQHPRLGLPH